MSPGSALSIVVPVFETSPPTAAANSTTPLITEGYAPAADRVLDALKALSAPLPRRSALSIPRAKRSVAAYVGSR